MKRCFTFLMMFVFLGGVFAQTNVPNGDFETWYTVTVSPTLNYEDIGTGPTDNWTATLNSLAAVPAVAGGPGPVTVFKTNDKYSGNYAAKAVSANFPLGIINIFIPGMIGTAVMNNAAVTAVLGKPCNDCRPSKLKGYYKFEPVNGDSCIALLLLSKWNSVAKKRDTIGYGKWIQKEAVSEWSPFEVSVNYTGTGTVDSITMLVVASAGFNVLNFVGSKGQAGTTMYVDDLALEYPSGIQQNLMPEVSVKIWPNPVSDILTLQTSRNMKDASLEIFSTNGKLVASYSMSGSSQELPVYSLPNGNYHFRLMEGNASLSTGSFIINR